MGAQYGNLLNEGPPSHRGVSSKDVPNEVFVTLMKKLQYWSIDSTPFTFLLTIIVHPTIHITFHKTTMFFIKYSTSIEVDHVWNFVKQSRHNFFFRCSHPIPTLVLSSIDFVTDSNTLYVIGNIHRKPSHLNNER